MILQIPLNALADGPDVAFQVPARPQIHPPPIGEIQPVQFSAERSMKREAEPQPLRMHRFVKPQNPLAQEVEVVLRQPAQGLPPCLQRRGAGDTAR